MKSFRLALVCAVALSAIITFLPNQPQARAQSAARVWVVDDVTAQSLATCKRLENGVRVPCSTGSIQEAFAHQLSLGDAQAQARPYLLVTDPVDIKALRHFMHSVYPVRLGLAASRITSPVGHGALGVGPRLSEPTIPQSYPGGSCNGLIAHDNYSLSLQFLRGIEAWRSIW